MNPRDRDTYLRIDRDPAEELLQALRSALGHLAAADLTEGLLKVVIQVWQAEGGRQAIVGALTRAAEASPER